MKHKTILRIGQHVQHKGTNENADKVYTVTIIGFDQMAIHVKGECGNTYWLNKWNIL